MSVERYVLNLTAQDSGDHEVHHWKCEYYPKIKFVKLLGDHPSCEGAIRIAKDAFPDWKIDGCKSCCPDCHTS